MRVDVLNHQRIIDFLNESFQQEANVDLTSIDYMENIKQINIDWIRIKSLISARIDVRIYHNKFFNVVFLSSNRHWNNLMINLMNLIKQFVHYLIGFKSKHLILNLCVREL